MTRVPKLTKLAVVCFHMFLYLHNNAVGEELKKNKAPFHDIVKHLMERQHNSPIAKIVEHIKHIKHSEANIAEHIIHAKTNNTSIKHLKKRQTVAECKDGYDQVGGSTMCAVDSEYYVVGSAGVSDEDIQIILKTHNDHRAAVSPTARNMMKAYWDDELAKTAEKMAKQCYVGHDGGLDLTNYMPKYQTGSGQNAFFGSSNWKSAVDSWHGEVQYFVYGEDPEEYIGKDGWMKVGHYTQVVKDTVMLIGCGYAKCDKDYGHYLFCNYLTGQGGISHPYDDGDSCGDCPDSCYENLCDCGDNYCFHGGNLDINTCQCTCKFPWRGPRCLEHPCNYLSCKNGGKLNVDRCECECIYPWTGESCQTKECVRQLDPGHCGTQWPPAFCDTYYNVPQECPVMCAICPDPCPDLQCKHGALVLENEQCRCNCEKFYTGDTCDIKDCPVQLDPWHCGPGKDWPPSFCAIYSNVPGDCPVMCELCPDPCNGLQCENGGSIVLENGQCYCDCETFYGGDLCEIDLCKEKSCVNGDLIADKGECVCSCDLFYKGDSCDTQDCPFKLDPWYCGPDKDWPPSFCGIYSNVPGDCPIMCELCPDPCNGLQCENGGWLELENGQCNCNCETFYAGDSCEIDLCKDKSCVNGNFVVDNGECICSCDLFYKGDSCDTLDCPFQLDLWYCGPGKDWPPSFCGIYSNVPGECPIMCGLCPDPCNGLECTGGGERTLNDDGQCSCE